MVVTHYQRLLNYIVPDVVHVLVNGRIAKSGGKELALELEARGYDWVEEVGGGRVTESYLRQFEALAGNGDGGGAGLARSLRRAAMDRFARMGFPSARDEEWRFTPIAPIAQAHFRPAVSAALTRDAPPAVSVRPSREQYVV